MFDDQTNKGKSLTRPARSFVDPGRLTYTPMCHTRVNIASFFRVPLWHRGYIFGSSTRML
uniref:Uncharacterized protein n=1 Tax=Anguilla anguilla TaxID=7936 RepID=A0A0E9VLF5_ANGAN